MIGEIQPAAETIAACDVAPVIRQRTAAMKGYSGPQSINFPVGYAVIGSNQLYCGKWCTITSIWRSVYQPSVSYVYKKPESFTNNAGMRRRTRATAMKPSRIIPTRIRGFTFRLLISMRPSFHENNGTDYGL